MDTLFISQQSWRSLFLQYLQMGPLALTGSPMWPACLWKPLLTLASSTAKPSPTALPHCQLPGVERPPWRRGPKGHSQTWPVTLPLCWVCLLCLQPCPSGSPTKAFALRGPGGKRNQGNCQNFLLQRPGGRHFAISSMVSFRRDTFQTAAFPVNLEHSLFDLGSMRTYIKEGRLYTQTTVWLLSEHLTFFFLNNLILQRQETAGSCSSTHSRSTLVLYSQRAELWDERCQCHWEEG